MTAVVPVAPLVTSLDIHGKVTAWKAWTLTKNITYFSNSSLRVEMDLGCVVVNGFQLVSAYLKYVIQKMVNLDTDFSWVNWNSFNLRIFWFSSGFKIEMPWLGVALTWKEKKLWWNCFIEEMENIIRWVIEFLTG